MCARCLVSGGGEGKRGVWDGPGLTVGRARRRKIKGQISEEGGKGERWGKKKTELQRGEQKVCSSVPSWGAVAREMIREAEEEEKVSLSSYNTNPPTSFASFFSSSQRRRRRRRRSRISLKPRLAPPLPRLLRDGGGGKIRPKERGRRQKKDEEEDEEDGSWEREEKEKETEGTGSVCWCLLLSFFALRDRWIVGKTKKKEEKGHLVHAKKWKGRKSQQKALMSILKRKKRKRLDWYDWIVVRDTFHFVWRMPSSSSVLVDLRRRPPTVQNLTGGSRAAWRGTEIEVRKKRVGFVTWRRRRKTLLP